ncbi:MAG: hypothetical protein JNL29_00295 [Nitrospira sp.]|nr:hypothetical protein [Nitrospira sp.]
MNAVGPDGPTAFVLSEQAYDHDSGYSIEWRHSASVDQDTCTGFLV